jgi:succinate dehydrogenase hydrophobic anchor subunit
MPKSMISDGSGSIIGGERERIGLLGWLTLYLSGAILFFFLMVHILSVHFLSPEKISAETVLDHYRSGFLIVVSFGLLLFGALHAMVGLRRVLLDLDWFGKRGDRTLSTALALIGAVAILFGIVVFNQFFAKL